MYFHCINLLDFCSIQKTTTTTDEHVFPRIMHFYWFSAAIFSRIASWCVHSSMRVRLCHRSLPSVLHLFFFFNTFCFNPSNFSLPLQIFAAKAHSSSSSNKNGEIHCHLNVLTRILSVKAAFQSSIQNCKMHASLRFQR